MPRFHQIPCPYCGVLIAELAGARPLYQRQLALPNGKLQWTDPPPCPEQNIIVEPYVIELSPCGCEVSMRWAGAYTKEKTRRDAYEPPQPVIAMSRKEQEERIDALTVALTLLYRRRDKATEPLELSIVEIWISIIGDQITRTSRDFIVDGDPSARSLAKVAWVKDKLDAMTSRTIKKELIPMTTLRSLFDLTPSQKPYVHGLLSVEQGIPLYRLPNGTLSTTPAFPDQQPCSITTGTGVQTDEEKPIVTEKRNGQFSVRFRDDYKVFVTEQEAHDYAKMLIRRNTESVLLASASGAITTDQLITQLGVTPVEAKPPSPMPDNTARKKRTIRHIDLEDQ